MRPLHFGEESENRFGDWKRQAEAAEPNDTEPWECRREQESRCVSILSAETRRDKALCSGSRQQVATSLTFSSNAAHSEHPCILPSRQRLLCSLSRAAPVSAPWFAEKARGATLAILTGSGRRGALSTLIPAGSTAAALLPNVLPAGHLSRAAEKCHSGSLVLAAAQEQGKCHHRHLPVPSWGSQIIRDVLSRGDRQSRTPIPNSVEVNICITLRGFCIPF